MIWIYFRFPLYMLPNVINSLVEAKVSVDRVESFLLEAEKIYVPEAPLKRNGVCMNKATLAYEGVGRSVNVPNEVLQVTTDNRSILCRMLSFVPLLNRLNCLQPKPTVSSGATTKYLSDSEYETLLLRAQLCDANEIIDSLNDSKRITSLNTINNQSNEFNGMNPILNNSSNFKNTNDSGNERKKLLALSRIDFNATSHQIIAIVGQVDNFNLLLRLHLFIGVYFRLEVVNLL